MFDVMPYSFLAFSSVIVGGARLMAASGVGRVLSMLDGLNISGRNCYLIS